MGALAVTLSAHGAPGESRTPDLLVRSQTLYPAELRARVQIISYRSNELKNFPPSLRSRIFAYSLHSAREPPSFLSTMHRKIRIWKADSRKLLTILPVHEIYI